MTIVKAALWTVGAMLAIGALVDRAGRTGNQRFVQMTLDHQPARGA